MTIRSQEKESDRSFFLSLIAAILSLGSWSCHRQYKKKWTLDGEILKDWSSITIKPFLFLLLSTGSPWIPKERIICRHESRLLLSCFLLSRALLSPRVTCGQACRPKALGRALKRRENKKEKGILTSRLLCHHSVPFKIPSILWALIKSRLVRT